MHMRTYRITEWKDLVQTDTLPDPGTQRKADQFSMVKVRESAVQKLKVANRSMRRLAAPFEKGPFDASPFGVSKKCEPKMPLGFPKLTLLKALRAETPKLRL